MILKILNEHLAHLNERDAYYTKQAKNWRAQAEGQETAAFCEGRAMGYTDAVYWLDKVILAVTEEAEQAEKTAKALKDTQVLNAQLSASLNDAASSNSDLLIRNYNLGEELDEIKERFENAAMVAQVIQVSDSTWAVVLCNGPFNGIQLRTVDCYCDAMAFADSLNIFLMVSRGELDEEGEAA